MGIGCGFLTIREKAMVAPTVPAPTIATLAVGGLGMFVVYGFPILFFSKVWV